MMVLMGRKVFLGIAIYWDYRLAHITWLGMAAREAKEHDAIGKNQQRDLGLIVAKYLLHR